MSAAVAAAGIEESAPALRHTVATRLVCDHAHDLVLVADISDTPTSRPHAGTPARTSSNDAPALEDLAD